MVHALSCMRERKSTRRVDEGRILEEVMRAEARRTMLTIGTGNVL